jgi:hypothetical protein
MHMDLISHHHHARLTSRILLSLLQTINSHFLIHEAMYVRRSNELVFLSHIPSLQERQVSRTL